MPICKILSELAPALGTIGTIGYLSVGSGLGVGAFLINQRYFDVSPLTLIVKASGQLSDEKTKDQAELILKARLNLWAALTSAGLGIIWPLPVAALIYKFLNPHDDFDAFFKMLFVPYWYLSNKVPSRSKVEIPNVLPGSKI